MNVTYWTHLLRRCGGSISAVSSFYVIVHLSYLLNKKKRKCLLPLLYLNIAAAGFIESIATAMGNNEANTNLCLVQASLIQFGGCSSFIWIAMSAKILYDLIITKKQKDDINMIKISALIWIVYIVCFLYPPYNLHPFSNMFDITYGFGINGGCWMKQEQTIDYVWRGILFYIPLWFTIICLFYVYIKVWRYLKTNMELFINIGLFGLVLIIFFIPATIHRIWNFLNLLEWVKQEPSDGVLIAHAALSSFDELFNSTVIVANLIYPKCCNNGENDIEIESVEINNNTCELQGINSSLKETTTSIPTESEDEDSDGVGHPDLDSNCHGINTEMKYHKV